MTDTQKLVATLASAGCIGILGFILIKQRTPVEAQATKTMDAQQAATPFHREPEQLHSKTELDALLARTDKPVVIKFSSTWCPPCKAIKPIFHTISAERAARAYFAEIDVDGFPDKEHLNKLSVQTIPTIIIFKEGKPVKYINGRRTKDDLEAQFEQAGA